MHRETKEVRKKFQELGRSKNNFERLKVVQRLKDGSMKRVPFTRNHRDKQVGETLCFDVCNLLRNCIFLREKLNNHINTRRKKIIIFCSQVLVNVRIQTEIKKKIFWLLCSFPFYYTEFKLFITLLEGNKPNSYTGNSY